MGLVSKEKEKEHVNLLLNCFGQVSYTVGSLNNVYHGYCSVRRAKKKILDLIVLLASSEENLSNVLRIQKIYLFDMKSTIALTIVNSE